jgi:hypothetical protein
VDEWEFHSLAKADLAADTIRLQREPTPAQSAAAQPTPAHTPGDVRSGSGSEVLAHLRLQT